jgi:hypothetical protein
MAYYPTYNPYQMPQQFVPPQHNGLIWVQGEAGAKSHPVSAGQSVLLMDSESNCFFIKSADASGMPLPLRVFDYTERAVRASERVSTAGVSENEYVTRAEFERRIAALSGENRRGEENAE